MPKKSDILKTDFGEVRFRTVHGEPVIYTETGPVVASSRGQQHWRLAKKRSNGQIDRRTKHGRQFYAYVSEIREEFSNERAS